LGIALRLLLKGRLHGLVVGLYIAMGWAVVVALKPMLHHVATGGMVLLAAGGVAYTVGVIFYKWKSLPYHHAIWHGFVLLGSALHYFSVLFYVIPWPQTAR
jgi:hemolysin III